ncbi:MAG: hypothetical protein WCI43_09330, partial [Candidatus Firestonebacteria bacterium]
GLRLGDFNPMDLVLQASYAGNCSGLYWGVTFKYLSLKIKETASAFCGDIGLLQPFKIGEQNFAGAVGIYNLGFGGKFLTDTFDLPLSLKAGISGSPVKNWLISLDLVAPADSIMYAGFGSEYRERLAKDVWAALRCGYNSKNASISGLSVGAGFEIGSISLDYAYIPFGDLGVTHRFSISVLLDSGINISGSSPSVSRMLDEQGGKLIEQGEWKRALSTLSKASALDKNNSSVKGKLKKISDHYIEEAGKKYNQNDYYGANQDLKASQLADPDNPRNSTMVVLLEKHPAEAEGKTDYEMGLQFLKNNDFAQALKYFDKVNPDLAGVEKLDEYKLLAYRSQAEVLRDKEDYSGAIKHLGEAMKLRPFDNPISQRMDELRKERKEKSEEFYTKGIKLYYANQTRESIELFEKILNMVGEYKDVPYYYERAVKKMIDYYTRLGKPDEVKTYKDKLNNQ